jgi:3-oxoacyl-[acyl-carrier-protein] synthase II
MSSDEIDCLSLSANGSVHKDRHEARAIAALFNGHARSIPVTAIKSMLGETLGASGAMQTVALVETLRDGVLPGIGQLEQVEGDLPLEMASPHSRRLEPSTGLINSVGFDGGCCSIVVSRCDL